MSNLDDKLLEIMEDAGWKWDMEDEPTKNQLVQIKQAFADEGYVHVEDDVEVKDNILRIKDLHLMTGQEWYERFISELESGLDLPVYMGIWVKACARVAANLEERE